MIEREREREREKKKSSHVMIFSDKWLSGSNDKKDIRYL